MNAVRKPVAVLLALALAFAMLPALAEPAEAYYSGYTYRVYAEPNSGAQVLGTIAQGAPVNPLGNTNDGWRQISYISGGKTIKGWFYGDVFIPGERDAAWYGQYHPESGVRDASSYDMDKLFYQIVTYEDGRRVSSSGGVLSTVDRGGMYMYVTNQNGTVLYASWSTSSKELATYRFGTTLRTTRNTVDEKMMYVSDIDGKTGYVRMADIGALPLGAAIPAKDATRYAAASGATLYSVPGGYLSSRHQTYAGGTKVTLLNQYTSEWVYAEAYDSKGFFRLSELTQEKDSTAPSGRTMYVKGSGEMQYTILYTSPGEEGRNLGLYMKGTPVTALSAEGSYTKVQAGGLLGYMLTNELATSEEDPTADKQYAQVCLVCAIGAAQLYKAPSDSSSYVYIPEGTKVYRLWAAEGNFAYVFVNGMTGYMLKGSLASPQANGEVTTVTEVLDPQMLKNAAPVPGSVTDMIVATGNSGKLHLRKTPSSSSTSLGKFENGTRVTVTGTTGNWVQVSLTGKTGYMMLQYLAPVTPMSEDGPVSGGDGTAAPTPIPATGTYAAGGVLYVQTGNDGKLNLRAKAAASATSIGRYANGTPVTILNDTGAWLQVRAEGRTGYMMRKYLSSTAPSASSGQQAAPGDAEATPSASGNADTTPAPTASATLTMVVQTGNDERLHLRKQPRTTAVSLGLFANGTVLTVNSTANDWANVTVNGQTGYMMLKFLAAN